MKKWSHEAYLYVPTPDGEDEVEIVVLLHFAGQDGARDYYNAALGAWEPGDAPEYELTHWEIMESPMKWRKPVLDPRAFESDAPLEVYIERWLDAHEEEIWESYDD